MTDAHDAIGPGTTIAIGRARRKATVSGSYYNTSIASTTRSLQSATIELGVIQGISELDRLI